MTATTASSRLRKAFRYPSDNDSDEPEDLDEEHQEQLISSLQSEDARKNKFYRKAFLSIPVFGALFSLSTFLLASSPRQRLTGFLGFTSMCASAYILYFMPIELPERKGKIPVYQAEAAKGPVEKYLVILNAGLVIVVQLVGLLSWMRGEAQEAARETLPTIVFGSVMFVRQLLAPLNLEELRNARFELKGA